jgi:hypothetical protein
MMPVRKAAATNRLLPIANEAKLASLSIDIFICNTEVLNNTRILAKWHTPRPIARPQSGVARIGHWTKLP